jgi:hypothetical protein
MMATAQLAPQGWAVKLFMLCAGLEACSAAVSGRIIVGAPVESNCSRNPVMPSCALKSLLNDHESLIKVRSFSFGLARNVLPHNHNDSP